MNDGRKVYDYQSYSEYIATQRGRSMRSQGQTKSYWWYRDRLATQLNALCPTAKTMLCLGARNKLEIEDFESKGFSPEGIDLVESPRIAECDMSRLYCDDRFSRRTFDIFVAIHSLEHCLDFDGFLRSLELCRMAFACVTPLLERPTDWDCSAFEFAHPNASAESLVNAFPGFELGCREVHKRTLLFVLLRTCGGDRDQKCIE